MSSQYGQDRLVLELLGEQRGGFFLDSGAADGIRSSNTHLLETSFDWKGICVEPNASLFAALVKNRRCYCVNCCLYHWEGAVDFLESAAMLGGILDEYHPSHLRYAMKTFRIPAGADGRPTTVRKQTRTLRSVLRACGAPPVIDYWSLDTEGSELAILKSFPFDEYSFRVLTVEHNRLPVRTQIDEFLRGYGYRKVGALEIDDCYLKDAERKGSFVKSEVVPCPSWRSHAWRRL